MLGSGTRTGNLLSAPFERYNQMHTTSICLSSAFLALAPLLADLAGRESKTEPVAMLSHAPCRHHAQPCIMQAPK